MESYQSNTRTFRLYDSLTDKEADGIRGKLTVTQVAMELRAAVDMCESISNNLGSISVLVRAQIVQYIADMRSPGWFRERGDMKFKIRVDIHFSLFTVINVPTRHCR
jgi:hypothetical protein